MPTERLTMRQIREILRQKWTLGCSNRQVSASLGVAVGTVSVMVGRATHAAATGRPSRPWTTRPWRRASTAPRRPWASCAPVDPLWIHNELKKTGVTLELLHLEYLEQHPDGYATPVLRALRVAGPARPVHAPGAPRRRQALRRLLGQEARFDPRPARRRVRALRRGAGRVQLHLRRGDARPSASPTSSAATSARSSSSAACPGHRARPAQVGRDPACRYEPGIQRTYEEMAPHYGTTVLPARPAPRATRPRSRSPCRSRSAGSWPGCATRPSSRWRRSTRASPSCSTTSTSASMRGLRHEPPRALRAAGPARAAAAARRALRLRRLEALPRQHRLPRRGRPPLLLGPVTRWCTSRSRRASALNGGVLPKGQRVASHPRSYERGRHTTIAEHMPKAHQRTRVDALAHRQLGQHHRPEHRGPGRPRSCRAPPSRAGLPLLPGHPPAGQALRRARLEARPAGRWASLRAPIATSNRS